MPDISAPSTQSLLTDGHVWRHVGLSDDDTPQCDYLQRFVVKCDHPMLESRIDTGTVLRVASVLLFDFVEKRRVLYNEKTIVFQSAVIERMTLQSLIIGVAEFVLKHRLELQESDRASGSNWTGGDNWTGTARSGDR